MAAHQANPIVKTRFENVKDIEHTKRMVCEFFCAGSGGPEQYTGKDMAAAHKGMNISEQEYLAVMDDVVEALTKNNIDDNTSRKSLPAANFRDFVLLGRAIKLSFKSV